jgi:hypothetical protein
MTWDEFFCKVESKLEGQQRWAVEGPELSLGAKRVRVQDKMQHWLCSKPYQLVEIVGAP